MKKAFTLIELLIVIIIIGVLLYALKGVFSYKNVEQLKFDTCYIHAYGKITSFMQKSLLQKMYYDSGSYHKIGLYTIKFDIANQKMELIYSGKDKKYKEELLFSGDGIDKINDCYTKSYFTQISGSNLEININPGLQTYIGQPGIKMLSGSTNLPLYYSGNIIFSYCDNRLGTGCKQKYKLSFLPSVYVVKNYFCRKIAENGKCKKWSE